MRKIDHYRRKWKDTLVRRYLRHLQIYCDAIRLKYEATIPRSANLINTLAELNSLKGGNPKKRNLLIKIVNDKLFTEQEKANGSYKPCREWKGYRNAQITKPEPHSKFLSYGISHTHLHYIRDIESDGTHWSTDWEGSTSFRSQTSTWEELDKQIGYVKIPYDYKSRFWEYSERQKIIEATFNKSSGLELDKTGLLVIKGLLLNGGHRYFCLCGHCKKPFIDFFYFRRTIHQSGCYCPEKLYSKFYCRQYQHRVLKNKTASSTRKTRSSLIK